MVLEVAGVLQGLHRPCTTASRRAPPATLADIAFLSGTLEGGPADIDSPEYWAIDPSVVAAEVIHAIDQPCGVTIGDVTVRATGEDFVV